LNIVSLLASTTEITCALGLGSHLVGRSHECDYPPQVRRLPQCSRPRFPDGSSRAIDASVRSLVEQALSLYSIDVDLLESLAPDVILTQDQCEVCAVTLADVERALAGLSSRPRVVSVKPFSLEDVLADVLRISVAIDQPDRGRELVERMKQGLAAPTVQSLRSIVCLEWLDPLMACGYWAPQLVERAGGRDLLGCPRGHAPWIQLDALIKADPDVILAMPCGFGLERAAQEMKALVSQSSWSSLRAVRSGQVYAADGNAYFNRPGPRLVESREILQELLHPELGPSRWKGTGWRRV
jgi:iron complex transport system substrate-binding protein